MDLYRMKDCFTNMDLYITDSLQDMLDIDIKSEMATDLGSGADFTDTFEMSFAELPPLVEMDDNSMWISSSHHNSSSFVHNLDLYGSEANAVMVNPNSVMPSIFAESPKKIVNQTSSNLMLNSVNSDIVTASPPPSPSEKSHLTFSPNTIKLVKAKEEMEEVEESQETESSDIFSSVLIKRDPGMEVVKKDLSSELDGKKVKMTALNGTTPVFRIKSSQPEVLRINSKNCSILNSNNRVNGSTQFMTTQSLGTKTIISGNIHILGAQQSRTLLSSGNKNQATILIDNSSLNNNRHLIKTTISNGLNVSENGGATKYVMTGKTCTGEFPKPAYSYSCLIAMALKNSRTGSLPVSEIYNFMCQHFPYFKTAPNGWKNSVRHNLSLNKCFEKIEKPSTNGSQRKGCLWAMNPAKVGKMDEEVQKWSRKDPQAIRKAMIYPDSLEALERGEMKYNGAGLSDADADDCEGDMDDIDTEIDPDVDGELDEVDDQETSDVELDIENEELSKPSLNLNVGGTYRLVTSSGVNAHTTFITEEETSDIEVMDGTYDEISMEHIKPLKLEFALAQQFRAENPAKRSKTSLIYQPVTAATVHTNRRKTPLVNRIA